MVCVCVWCKSGGAGGGDGDSAGGGVVAALTDLKLTLYAGLTAFAVINLACIVIVHDFYKLAGERSMLMEWGWVGGTHTSI